MHSRSGPWPGLGLDKDRCRRLTEPHPSQSTVSPYAREELREAIVSSEDLRYVVGEGTVAPRAIEGRQKISAMDCSDRTLPLRSNISLGPAYCAK